MDASLFTGLAVDQVKAVQSDKLKKNAAVWIKKVRDAENRIIPVYIPIELKRAHRAAIESNKKLEISLRDKVPEMANFLDKTLEQNQTELGFFWIPVLIGVFALSSAGLYTANRYINLESERLKSAEYQIEVYQNTYDVVYAQTNDPEKAQEMAWQAVAAATSETITKQLDKKISDNQKKMLYVAGGLVAVFFVSKWVRK